MVGSTLENPPDNPVDMSGIPCIFNRPTLLQISSSSFEFRFAVSMVKSTVVTGLTITSTESELVHPVVALVKVYTMVFTTGVRLAIFG